MTMLWKRLGLGLKLSVTNFVLFAILTGALISLISYSVSNAIESREEREMMVRSTMLKDLIAASDYDLRVRTRKISEALHKQLGGRLDVSPAFMEINGQKAPIFLHDGFVINETYDLVDQFRNTTSAMSSIMARVDDDFVRITTSLVNDKNERPVGTLLDRNNPGYIAAMAGQSHTGLAELFGRQYMTHYEPIIEKGNIIGLTFVGLDFSDFLTTLKDKIRALKVGETGYYYVLNAAEGPKYGELVIHPAQEGQNVITSKDADGREFIRDLMQQREGYMHYPWINTALGEKAPREKLVAFTYYEPWEWIIAGGTYTEEYTREITALINTFILIGLIALVLVSILWYWLIKVLIVKPLGAVGTVAETISTGDLTVQMHIDRQDEIGHLMGSINRITEGLTRVVGTVRADAYSLASASAQIAQGNQDLSARTESQASALTETAASMEELEATVRQNADNAGTANQLASQASAVAERGGQVVSEVVDTMQGINDSSRRIADIISVIDSIAFQTNILALNAAVEAARAGEHGQGFAVVASEVRSLSARSAAAAKEIRELINDSVQRVENGTELVHRAGTTMSEVVQSIQRVTDIMREISAASTEQQQGVGQIADAVTQMDQAVQQNSALVEEMAAAAASLREQSDDLVEAVSVFRLDQNDHQGGGNSQAQGGSHAHTRGGSHPTTPQLAH